MKSRSGFHRTALALLHGAVRMLAAPVTLVCAACVVSAFLAGCAAAAPRFGATHHRTDTTVAVEDSVQMSPDLRTEAEEELRENDRPLDVQSTVLTIASLQSENPALDHRKVIDEILSMLGTPYAYSGTDSLGIDCSGFTARVFRNAMQLDLPHSSREQYRLGRKIAPDRRKLGDLLFFRTRRSGPSHVGIYLGRDLFAHASVSLGVTISSLESTYYKRRYLGARRIVE